jgi:hypothetical protein
MNDRPKYGALNIMRYFDGSVPRFGCCTLRLKREVNLRSTYSYGGSQDAPKDVGTSEFFEPVLAALLKDIAEKPLEQRLGWRFPDLKSFVSFLETAEDRREMGRCLDEMIEVQIHGEIRMGSDIDALIADPSFRGTETGLKMERLAAQYGFPIYWHDGYELNPGDINEQFRGPRIPPLGIRVDKEYGGSSGKITAEVIGRAAVDLSAKPEVWADWGSENDTFQHLKQLWHTVVRYGRHLNLNNGQ